MPTAREDQDALTRKAVEAFLAHKGGRKLDIKMVEIKDGMKLTITIKVKGQMDIKQFEED